MKKNFRSVKATLIIGILLTSAFVATIPISSAREGGLLMGFSHVVEIQWQHNETEVVKPFQETGTYTAVINYKVIKGGFAGDLIYGLLYAGRVVNIQLNIEEYPREWSTVSIIDNTITTGLPRVLDTWEDPSYTKQIFITVDDNAPAFRDGEIKIRVTVETVGPVDKFDEVQTLRFRPDYSPKLNILPETQHKIIGPMDTAEIPIRVTNLGNGQTKVFFRVSRIPDNWVAIVTDQITLDPDQTDTIFLTVKPPKGFGYHDDYEGFVVECTPAWAENTKIQGVTETVSVAVESRGISVIGIEVILPFIILIILVVIAVYLFLKRIRRK